MMFIQPFFERAMFFLKFQNLLRIDNGGIDLQSVADDTRILKQARAVFLGVFGNFCDFESMICLTEIVRFFQDGDPRKPGLVNLKDEAFEKLVIAG